MTPNAKEKVTQENCQKKKPAHSGLFYGPFFTGLFCGPFLRALSVGAGRIAATMKNKFSSKIRAFMIVPSLFRQILRARAGQARHRGVGFLVLAVCALSGGVATAEKADRNKPMNVEADALRYDDLKQSSVFTGRVVLSKGTIIIRGARLEVRQDPEGYQFGLVIAEAGKLAFFRQKREGVDEFIEGEGEVIEYDGRADTVKFIKRAQLRRYRGAVLNDEMTGGVILYDNAKDVFTIDSGVARGATGTPGGRVRAMLTPKPDPSVTAPALGSAAQQLAPVLRPSSTLGGEQK